MDQTLANLNDTTDMQNLVDELSDQVARLQADLDRNNQAILQIQNATTTGVGSVTPTQTRGGIAVPPVSRLTAINLGTVVGETAIGLTWLAPEAVSSPVDHYNVYVTGSQVQQIQPTLVASPAASPAAFTIQPTSAGTVVITVQTALRNGQVNSLDQCPTATVVVTIPVIPVTSGGTGTATGSITGTGALTFISGPTNTDLTLVTNGTGKIKLKPGTDSTTAIQLQNAAGTAVATMNTTNGVMGIGTTGSTFTSRNCRLQLHGTTDRNLLFHDLVNLADGVTIQSINDALNTNKGLEIIASRIRLNSSVNLYTLVGLPFYATNATAVTGGLAAGDLYRTNTDPDTVCVVH